MGLTKRKDGWYVEFPVYDDGQKVRLAIGAVGAKLRRWKAGKNKNLAKDIESEIRTKLHRGEISSARVEVTLPWRFDQWAVSYKQIEEVIGLDSYRERCQRIDQVLIPFFGKKLLQDITVQDVETFRRVRGEGRALATVNVDHNILKHMLKHAMKRPHLRLMQNVASFVAVPKPKNARDRVLTSDEWTQLYTAAPAWFQPVLLTAYHTGMRLEEVLGLTWDRVDPRRSW